MQQLDNVLWAISIHALREEGDTIKFTEASSPDQFLSTPSARRATEILGLTGTANLFLSTPSARRAT